MVDFGGNWCGDCQVLDIYFHNPENRPILESNFVLVHVNIGHMDENLDIAERYGIPVTKGVPALAVLRERARCSTASAAGSSAHGPHGILGRDPVPGAVEAGQAGLLGDGGELLKGRK